MNKYISNTSKQEEEMLASIGIDSVDRLFECIPRSVRDKNRLEIPKGLSDLELERHLSALANKNANANDYLCFIGAGAYDRYIPAVVKTIMRRQEFLTAYTPYQPEASQGLLQAIFEYQTMICNLTGMEGSNASLYDAGSALYEAVALSVSVNKKKKVLVSACVNPRYRQVLNTYIKYRNMEIIEIPYENGVTDLSLIKTEDLKESSCVVIQNPNYLGCLEDMETISEFAKKNDLHFIVSTNPVSLGLLKAPGEYEADIVTGDGQELGNPLSFGGPYLGFMAVSKPFIRKMPGRIVGQTVDNENRKGFVLTMQAREQHIRREKAGSNICSNQALNALTAAVYMATMGKSGIVKVAELSFNKAHYLYDNLLKTGVFKKIYTSPFFMEFTLEYQGDIDLLEKKYLDMRIFFGHKIDKEYNELKNSLLIAVTEKLLKRDLDEYIRIAGDNI